MGCHVPRSCRIFGFPVLMRHEGKIILGERVLLNSLPWLYRIGQWGRCILSTSRNGLIHIGDDTGINGSAIHAEKHVQIGKRVLVAAGCRISDINFHPVDALPRRYLSDHDPKPVIIEDDVWLGADVMVLPGVTIGRGSVVSAKSVVTKNIPPGVLAGGIPATVLRELKLPK